MRSFIVTNGVEEGRRITRGLVIAQDSEHAINVVRSFGVEELDLPHQNMLLAAIDIGQMDHAPVDPIYRHEGGMLLLYNLFEPMIKAVSTVTPTAQDRAAAATIKQDPPRPTNQPQARPPQQQRKSGDPRRQGQQGAVVPANGTQTSNLPPIQQPTK